MRCASSTCRSDSGCCVKCKECRRYYHAECDDLDFKESNVLCSECKGSKKDRVNGSSQEEHNEDKSTNVTEEGSNSSGTQQKNPQEETNDIAEIAAKIDQLFSFIQEEEESSEDAVANQDPQDECASEKIDAADGGISFLDISGITSKIDQLFISNHEENCSSSIVQDATCLLDISLISLKIDLLSLPNPEEYCISPIVKDTRCFLDISLISLKTDLSFHFNLDEYCHSPIIQDSRSFLDISLISLKIDLSFHFIVDEIRNYFYLQDYTYLDISEVASEIEQLYHSIQEEGVGPNDPDEEDDEDIMNYDPFINDPDLVNYDPVAARRDALFPWPTTVEGMRAMRDRVREAERQNQRLEMRMNKSRLIDRDLLGAFGEVLSYEMIAIYRSTPCDAEFCHFLGRFRVTCIKCLRVFHTGCLYLPDHDFEFCVCLYCPLPDSECEIGELEPLEEDDFIPRFFM